MKKHLLLVFLVLLTMVAYVGCGGGSETTDGDVDGDDTVDGDTDKAGEDGDTDGDVTEDGDDDATEQAEETEDAEDTGCKEDDDCDTGYVCEATECIEACEADADCEGDTVECNTETGHCQEIACVEHSDCPTGFVCGPGTCIAPVACPDDTTGFSVMVNGGNGMLAQGGDLTLSAVLLDADGARVVLTPAQNNFSFDLTGTDTASIVASTTDDTAVLTGGDTAGAVELTVSLTCVSPATDNTKTVLSFTNYLAPASTDARVVVYDSATGEPIEGATVFLTAVAAPTKDTSSVATDTTGAATFSSLDCTTNGCNLHVLDADYTYVSAFGVKTNDILVPVAPNVDITKAGGVVGHQDNSEIPELIRGDVYLGISMFSIPGNLADLNFESLIGEMIETHVEIGGTISEDIGLPGGLEGYLNPDQANRTALKDGFKVTGIGGSGTLWGLGGFTNLGDILDLAQPALQGGDLEIGTIVAALIPIFANFYHGIMPGLEFTESPKVTDSEDINGNGDKTDKVADFDSFLDLQETFAVSQAQTQSALVKFGALPKDGDTCLADAAITLMGVMQDGVGFIPLGLSAVLDEDADGNTNCALDDVDVAFAPQHSGLYGYTYYTLSVALNVSALTGSLKDTAIELSGTVSRSDTIPTQVTIPDYLGMLKNTTYNTTTHTLSTTDVAGANFHRVVFNVTDEDSQNYWHIYWAAGNGFTFDFSSLGITDDRSAGSALAQAVKLDGVTYDDLFTFNATNLNDMNGFITGFSMSTVAAPAK